VSLVFYAIADCAEREVEGRGLKGRPLRGVSEGELVAVVSEQAGGRPNRESEALWQYERAVEELMARHAVVPARFGSVFEQEADLRRMLRERSSELRAAVTRVRDAVELALRATWSRPPERGDPEQSGTAYMQRRLAEHRRAEHAARALEPLDRLARASQRRLQPDAATAFASAYLVDREVLDQFTELVRELDQRLDDVGLVLTGPWPPYSFAEGEPA
jgi:hypothetical protein